MKIINPTQLFIESLANNQRVHIKWFGGNSGDYVIRKMDNGANCWTAWFGYHLLSRPDADIVISQVVKENRLEAVSVKEIHLLKSDGTLISEKVVQLTNCKGA